MRERRWHSCRHKGRRHCYAAGGRPQALAAGIRLPLEFPGAGEYLAICRKEGAAVDFADGSPPWFAEQMKRLPSWQKGYFTSEAEQPGQTAVLVCVTCGGSGSYAADRDARLCQFCGSSELRAPARK